MLPNARYYSVKRHPVNAIAPVDAEPLVRLSDLDEYRVWPRTSSVGRMGRGKLDRLPHPLRRLWPEAARRADDPHQGPRRHSAASAADGALASSTGEFCQGDLHVTTRQDVQSLFRARWHARRDALDFLYKNGLTTREACGNTFRNVTACALAGSCPRERVDAGAVADRLARSWIRNPLVQHMPRKMKILGLGLRHRLRGFVDPRPRLRRHRADGKHGLHGLCRRRPGRPAASRRSKVLDFVTEDESAGGLEATRPPASALFRPCQPQRRPAEVPGQALWRRASSSRCSSEEFAA